MKVAVYRTRSAGCSLIFSLLTRHGFDVQYVDRDDVESERLGFFSVVLFPGSYEHVFSFLSCKRFRVNLRKYVEEGGRFIGVCGGAVLGDWVVNGFGWNALRNVWNGLYYLRYLVFGRLDKFKVEWMPDNLFGEKGMQVISWAGGPSIPDSFSQEAVYAESKFLLPFKDKTAVGFVGYGCGSVLLFGPHPEFSCCGVDNSRLILKAVEKSFKV